ncbi:hypothetical protein F9U64_07415 [Gracilibacillus oryzae]|uniref:Glycerophosphoryl diester phosphodiesterase membrane domain-containing protein n=1 Tax=Gracilibacillus oryzae TaxID=1672701 RepID=A0A7C8GU24_9BACI|nr:hypothetical protein [Gracilibacillus oryzae]KAB8137867.1 hypothetical protein F9U64_07415 [Gracilibacillus oryzae]
MNTGTQKPLNFGKILDQTFRILKNYFKPLFMISLLIMTPIYLLQILTLLISGRDFIMSADPSQNFLSQLTANTESFAITTITEDIGVIISGLLTVIATPIIVGATIYAVKFAREGKKVATRDMIKMALPRYWPMFGTTLLLGIIIFLIIFSTIFLAIFIGAAASFAVHPIVGILLGFLLVAGIFIGAGLLLTRWSLSIAAVLFERVAPGFTKSWHLTKRQTWKFFGLFIILYIIMYTISSILQVPLILLGNSILSNLLINFITMVANIIVYAGYAVMYFDAHLRYEAGDIKEMLDSYDSLEQS